MLQQNFVPISGSVSCWFLVQMVVETGGGKGLLRSQLAHYTCIGNKAHLFLGSQMQTKGRVTSETLMSNSCWQKDELGKEKKLHNMIPSPAGQGWGVMGPFTASNPVVPFRQGQPDIWAPAGPTEIPRTHGSLGFATHVSWPRDPGTSAPAPNPTSSGVLATVAGGQLILRTPLRTPSTSSPSCNVLRASSRSVGQAWAFGCKGQQKGGKTIPLPPVSRHFLMSDTHPCFVFARSSAFPA